MKKKLLYGIFFVSIFLLSTASMVQPVRGYEFGVPDEATGVTTNGEVKIFDEDEVDKHLGAGVDLDNELHGGDCDVVGAKSQTLYGEIEKDEEIDYLHDFVLSPADIPAAAAEIRGVLQTMALNLSTYAPGTYGPLGWVANYSLQFIQDNPGAPYPWTVSGAGQAYAAAAQPIASLAVAELLEAIDEYATLKAKYSKDYDGVILNRETWDFAEDHADLDDDADDDDNPAPFFADPRDWKDVADNLAALENDINSQIDSIQQYWGATSGWYITFAGAVIQYAPTFPGGHPLQGLPDFTQMDWSAYEALNTSIAMEIMKIPATNEMEISNKGLFGTCKPQPLPMWQALLGLMDVENDPLYNIMSAKAADIAALIGGVTPEYVQQNIIDVYYKGAIPSIYGNYTTDYVAGLFGAGDLVMETIYARVAALIPDQAGFFLGQLVAGQPGMTPSGDFMTKVIEEYNLDEDGETLYDMYGFHYGKDLPDEYGCYDGSISDVPLGAVSRFTGTDLGGETVYPQAYMEIEWDGSAVIVEVEWQEDYIDPKDWTAFGGDNEDELKDFEIEFPYGEGGTQGTVSYKDGDDIFWQMGGVDQIPGFEISILLGASAVAILGLIYIVMKKRKM